MPPVHRTLRIRRSLLTTCFATAFAAVSVGNHFAIFWGTNGFDFWRLRNYLPAALFFEASLLLLAIILAPIATCRFAPESIVDRAGLTGLIVYPVLLGTLTFGILRLIGLPNEKTLMLFSAILVVLQVFAVAYNCRRMIGSWRLTAGLTLVCGTAGVSASLFHIMINSLVT